MDRGSVASKMVMEMRKINKFGRTYRPGVALDQDFKCLIIDSIISYGGDRMTGSAEFDTTGRRVACFSEHFEICIAQIL